MTARPWPGPASARALGAGRRGWRVVGEVLVAAYLGANTALLMFITSIVAGRSLEAATHGALAAGAYLTLGIAIGRWHWRWS